MTDYKHILIKRLILYTTFIACIILGWNAVLHFRYEIKPLYHSNNPIPKSRIDYHKVQVVAKGSIPDYLKLRKGLQASPYRIKEGNELDMFYYALIMATKYHYTDGYFDAYQSLHKQFRAGTGFYPIDSKDEQILKHILIEGEKAGNRKCINVLRKGDI